jgi:hypothetical protein
LHLAPVLKNNQNNQNLISSIDSAQLYAHPTLKVKLNKGPVYALSIQPGIQNWRKLERTTVIILFYVFDLLAQTARMSIIINSSTLPQQRSHALVSVEALIFQQNT